MDTIKEKRTRIMTPELLEKLRFAREKANQKRSELANLKKMEKDIKIVSHETKVKEVTEAHRKATAKPPVVVLTEEPEDDPEPEPVARPVARPPSRADYAYHSLFNTPPTRRF